MTQQELEARIKALEERVTQLESPRITREIAQKLAQAIGREMAELGERRMRIN
jgi:hypothetical protein